MSIGASDNIPNNCEVGQKFTVFQGKEILLEERKIVKICSFLCLHEQKKRDT